MVEGQARTLFTSAVTRIISHLHLWDLSFDLGALLEPLDPELHDVAAEAVKEKVEALVRKFLYVDPAAAADKDSGDVSMTGLPMWAKVVSKAEEEAQRRRFRPS